MTGINDFEKKLSYFPNKQTFHEIDAVDFQMCLKVLLYIYINHKSQILNMMSDWILDILFNIQTETRYLVKYPGYPPSNINTEIHSKKISVWFDLFKSDTGYLVKYSAEYKISGQIFGIPSLKYTTVYPLKPNIRPDSEFGIGPDAIYIQVWISYRPYIQ